MILCVYDSIRMKKKDKCVKKTENKSYLVWWKRNANCRTTSEIVQTKIQS